MGGNKYIPREDPVSFAEFGPEVRATGLEAGPCAVDKQQSDIFAVSFSRHSERGQMFLQIGDVPS